MSQVKNDNILTRAPYDIDDRKGFSLNGTWYLFNSPEQALSNPDVINYRHIGMTIPIYDGADSQVDYWFYKGITDEDFVIKSSGSGVATTSGVMTVNDPMLVIDWMEGIVPDETVTWFEKHGDLEDVVVQTEVPTPDIPDSPLLGYFQQTLNSYKSLDHTSLILDNGGGDMRWLIFSKGTATTPIPPTPGFWSDSNTWVDTDNWED